MLIFRRRIYLHQLLKIVIWRKPFSTKPILKKQISELLSIILLIRKKTALKPPIFRFPASPDFCRNTKSTSKRKQISSKKIPGVTGIFFQIVKLRAFPAYRFSLSA